MINNKNISVSRANKRKSQKNIFPIEYINNKENIPIIKNILSIIDKYKNNNIVDIIISLALNLFKKNNIENKSNVKYVISEIKGEIIKELLELDLPINEDILGIIYQCLLTKGQKNINGSYYTPKTVIKSMIKDLSFNNNEIILDPCCGSGAFFLQLDNNNPNQLFGLDTDIYATRIAKINLIIKYKNIEFTPQIYCENYLTVFSKKPPPL